MRKEKVLAILHLTISGLVLGVICDVSELNLSAGEGFSMHRQEDSSHEDRGATRFSLINGLVDELPSDPKDRSRLYEAESQSNDIENNYAHGGYFYEKPAIPFEPVLPSRPPPLEPEPPFEPQQPVKPPFEPHNPVEPPYQPEVPLQPDVPLQPEFPLQPEAPSPTEEHTEAIGGYHYPRPQNPMTYPPQTTEQTFPEASARSILVE